MARKGKRNECSYDGGGGIYEAAAGVFRIQLEMTDAKLAFQITFLQTPVDDIRLRAGVLYVIQIL